MKIRSNWFRGALAGLVCVLSFAANAQESLRVAYFDRWATPNLAAQADGAFDRELGVPVIWQAFSTGAAMSEAMLAGDIDIAFSQGSESFVAAVNAGAPISAVAVAATYSAAEDCVARSAPDFQSGAGEWLVGKSVALPLNTLAEHHFRKTLAVLGVDAGSVTVVDLDSGDAATALSEGSVVMACGFGVKALERMLQVGESVLTPAQKRNAHLVHTDLVTVADEFLQRAPEVIRAFLRVTQAANVAHHQGKADVLKIAAAAKLPLADAEQQLDRADFPLSADQQRALLAADGAVVDLLAFTGSLLATDTHAALGDYSQVVKADYLP